MDESRPVSSDHPGLGARGEGNSPAATRREWLRAGGRYVLLAGLGGLVLDATRRISGNPPARCSAAAACAGCELLTRCDKPPAAAARGLERIDHGKQ